ncbi:hypothetical protein RJ639_005290 [Escallonia herrerae]|uniref:NAD(P)H-quinone oxidoreductase subunit M, chloroplastic n=1 Tax=Escallonia herrerae TaxID=1293975 RepID=A0AA88VX87_9ASTE|nr:hypothetical protein RJ639_005290 [Escallonia herrerae]
MAATTSLHMASTKFTMVVNWTGSNKTVPKRRNAFSVSAQQQAKVLQPEEADSAAEEVKEEVKKQLRPVEPQLNAQSKNMGKEYGSQWLSSATRHVRIYAAYVDPVTCAFDQTQTDKLTLLLDPTDEFVWTPETCNKVYSYFQDLIDHYEGAPLTEYTLRLIGSDIEHYIRKLLYDGEIQYNMNARVLNFSMGKPRVGFSYSDDQLQDVTQ